MATISPSIKILQLMTLELNNKIFCIGLNKTGTTSLGYFLESVGFTVANQRECELLLDHYVNRDFDSINQYVERSSSLVFQDVPFSLPFTFSHLDRTFPNSKFILTVRNSPEEWYKSIHDFHSRFFGSGKTPTKESLLTSNYVYQGWSWKLMSDVFFVNENSLYNKEEFVHFYQCYNQSVRKYFRNKIDQFLEINLGDSKSQNQLCEFLEITSIQGSLPRITSLDLLNGSYNCNFLKSN